MDLDSKRKTLVLSTPEPNSSGINRNLDAARTLTPEATENLRIDWVCWPNEETWSPSLNSESKGAQNFELLKLQSEQQSIFLLVGEGDKVGFSSHFAGIWVGKITIPTGISSPFLLNSSQMIAAGCLESKFTRKIFKIAKYWANNRKSPY